MDARELRKRAEHYRRVALVVSDEDVSRALLELAERYEALARTLTQEDPPAGDDRGPSLTVSSGILFYVSMLRACGEVLALQCRRDSGMIRR
jgi:hypothetical protein